MAHKPPAHAARGKRSLLWIGLTLVVCALLFGISTLVGKTGEDDTTDRYAAPTDLPPAPTPTYRVTDVLEGDLVRLVPETGAAITLRVRGIATAGSGGCFGRETLAWATDLLEGEEAVVESVGTGGGNTLGRLILADGTDYAVAALEAGYAIHAGADVNSSYGRILRDAESSARARTSGLWGPPCEGDLAHPPTSEPPPTTTTTTEPSPAPPPVVAEPAPPPPAPSSSDESEPEPSPDPEPHYASCRDVWEADAAPLHRWDPGYREELDRDGDGVACDRDRE
ncbi:thermonuclease family protein [Prauserella flavalba]|uniref:thermonuclease family protein n=1 Tax=Prauserella flavalba TaxID=1477506 RepID=UPI0036E60AA7